MKRDLPQIRPQPTERTKQWMAHVSGSERYLPRYWIDAECANIPSEHRRDDARLEIRRSGDEEATALPDERHDRVASRAIEVTRSQQHDCGLPANLASAPPGDLVPSQCVHIDRTR